MLGTALLLAVIAAVIWKKCCAQTSQTAPTIGSQEPQQMVQKQEKPLPQVQIIQQQQPMAPQPPPAYHVQNPIFQMPKPANPTIIYS
jgi:hypothetical protein